MGLAVQTALQSYIVAGGDTTATVTGPPINDDAKVKGHWSRTGETIPGQEEMRKVKFSFMSLPQAKSYEVSWKHKTGEKVFEAPDTCGGEPCFIHQNAPRGMNTYSIRAKLDEWTDWGPL